VPKLLLLIKSDIKGSSHHVANPSSGSEQLINLSSIFAHSVKKCQNFAVAVAENLFRLEDFMNDIREHSTTRLWNIC
jgi:hypothetical protein